MGNENQAKRSSDRRLVRRLRIAAIFKKLLAVCAECW
jgi:hypothetical protein